MSISECCNLGVVCCYAETPIAEVAALMRRHHVGDVVVIGKENEERVPIGIITDRDIVVQTTALGVDAMLLTAGDLMSAPLVTVREDAGFVDTLRLMREHKIRRIPVLSDSGTLFGIVTADDIISLLAMELSLMTGAIVEQPVQESKLRPSRLSSGE